MTTARRRWRVAVALSALLSLVGLATLPATSALARPVAARDTTVLLQSQSGWVAPTGTFRINIRVAAPPGSKLVARLYSGVNS
ncbi:MAG: hypothetical protein ACXV95_12655, partial [Acidimicrobiales bacterium]